MPLGESQCLASPLSIPQCGVRPLVRVLVGGGALTAFTVQVYVGNVTVAFFHIGLYISAVFTSISPFNHVRISLHPRTKPPSVVLLSKAVLVVASTGS